MIKTYDCGIDLGTTNSCIAYPTNNNDCIIIENTQDRMQVTPSAIAIDRRGRMTIGQRALNQKNCAVCFKRKMGTNESIQFKGTDVTKSPEELSSEILKSLKRDAESRLSEEMKDVVITVPAAFTSLQNEATKKAAEIAGFRNVILLQEPIAASIAYGSEANAKNQYWMVFDYGGGTLDVSIVSTHNGRLVVINSEGDNFCGGSDIDRMLYENIVKPELKKQYNIDNNYELDKKMIMSLERCKIDLSSSNSTYFEEFESEDNDGNLIEFEMLISREQLNETISKTVDECIQIAKKALEGAEKKQGINISSLNKILLVGGSTFIPYVREKLSAAFNTEIDCSLNPMTVVAQGAAIYSAMNSVEITDTEEQNTTASTISLPKIKAQFDAITSDFTANVIGTIENINEHQLDKIKIDAVKSADASGSIWSSGWIPFTDENTGLFDIDVHLTPGNNKFVVFVQDKNGHDIPTENNTFEIKHNSNQLKVSSPPATFSVCVLVNDGGKDVLKPLIDKNTPLPAEGVNKFKIRKDLDPSFEDSIDIQIWEGENFTNPESNNWVGSITLKSTALERRVKAGTTIEITITQDESRTIHVSGYIPDADYEIPEASLHNKDERLSLKKMLLDLRDKMTEVSNMVSSLSTRNINMHGCDQSFYNLQKQYGSVLNSIENDSERAQLYIRDFWDVHTNITDLYKAHAQTEQSSENKNMLQRIKEMVKQYGSQREVEEFEQMIDKCDSADEETFQKQVENVSENYGTFINNNFNFIKDYFRQFLTPGVPFSDVNQADYWINQGKIAIRDQDITTLRNAAANLERLYNEATSQSNNTNTTKATSDLQL